MPLGEKEYIYVTKEVYEALTETFRREAHASGDAQFEAHNQGGV